MQELDDALRESTDPQSCICGSFNPTIYNGHLGGHDEDTQRSRIQGHMP